MSWYNLTCFRVKKSFKENDQIFFNNHPIDTFVDEFWMIHCTEDKSTCEINDLIRKVLHLIIQMGQEKLVSPESLLNHFNLINALMIDI